MNGVFALTGPTATGKTALGVLLAQSLGGEVVSADAMQVYRGMIVGTAAPTRAEMGGVPHHLIGCVSPLEDYSVGRYVEDAARCVDGILSRGRLPILVGGTGLYLDSLLRGRDFSGGDAALRARFAAEYDARGGEALLNRLAAVDAERASKLHPGDKKRIVRALEVFYATGETITAHDRRTRSRPPRYRYVKLALSFADRQALYARIDARAEAMLASGLLDEVRALLASGAEGRTAMQAIGYKELAAYLRGECGFEAAGETIRRRSRNYAKRQLSYLRAQADVQWLLWESEPNFQEARRVSTQIMEKAGIL